MLTKCRALVLADTPGRLQKLSRFAQHVGFVEVSPPGRSLASLAPEVPVFFFIHDEMDDALKIAGIEWVREHERPLVRFAPIIVISSDISAESVLKYVKMGCDDVIIMPDEREELVSRVQSQLEREQLYIETDSYVGPDRRRMEASFDEDSADRRGDRAIYTRVIVRRSPGHGAFVVSSETFGQPDEPRAEDLARDDSQTLEPETKPGCYELSGVA